jgi:hypothetical protein
MILPNIPKWKMFRHTFLNSALRYRLVKPIFLITKAKQISSYEKAAHASMK